MFLVSSTIRYYVFHVVSADEDLIMWVLHLEIMLNVH